MTETVNTEAEAVDPSAPIGTAAASPITRFLFGLGILVFASMVPYALIVAATGNATAALIVAIVIVVAILAYSAIRRARVARGLAFQPEDLAVPAPRDDAKELFFDTEPDGDIESDEAEATPRQQRFRWFRGRAATSDAPDGDDVEADQGLTPEPTASK